MAAYAPVTTELDFECLVREHQRMVYSIAYHFLRDRTAAEEVAQDVFMELHAGLAKSKINSGQHAANWLRRVACHRSIDYARRLPKAMQVDWDSIPEPSQPAEASDPMRSELLQQMVASLPEKMRLVVILKYQEEAEPDEIARVLDIPVNTVKSHIHRALKMLRSKMGLTEGKASA
jgi:RNA polymerase sigma-70 factor, ECF subfamily